jgi:uncharacterized protein
VQPRSKYVPYGPCNLLESWPPNPAPLGESRRLPSKVRPLKESFAGNRGNARKIGISDDSGGHIAPAKTPFLVADQVFIFPNSSKPFKLVETMRLTSVERAEIVALAKRRFGRHAVVRLFGSRIAEDGIGGDIDLHIQAENSDLATLANELEFVVELKDRIGDEKIDVIVRGPDHSPRGIDDVAVQTGIVL